MNDHEEDDFDIDEFDEEQAFKDMITETEKLGLYPWQRESALEVWSNKFICEICGQSGELSYDLPSWAKVRCKDCVK